MEPKSNIPNRSQNTVGAFISALRRANGMTQRELGERLFVSDKTVSRWERGECDPELSLIPAIAEIFGVTTDELLRGARNPSREEDGAESVGVPPQRTARSEKQFRAMLNGRLSGYRNLSLISVGLTILGVLTAAIFNLALTQGIIGFCLGTACIVASAICQLCFSSNARLASEFEEEYEDDIRAANTRVTQTLLKILAFDVTVLAFLLPIGVMTDPYTGLTFRYWMLYGAIFSFATLTVIGLFYVFLLRDLLVRSEWIFLCEAKRARLGWEKRLLVKTLAVAIAFALVIAVGGSVLQTFGAGIFAKREVFDTFEAFSAYMEEHKYHAGYDASGNEVHIRIETVFDESVADPEGNFYDPSSDSRVVEIPGKDGSTLYEYVHSDFVSCVEWNFENSDDGLPVKVITSQAMHDARLIYNTVLSALNAALFADVILSAVIYIVKVKRKDNAEG